jgi:hypothetical protein
MSTLTPAYGRDYKSKKEVVEAFESGKDFIYNSYDGQVTYCSKEDLLQKNVKSVQIRFKNNTQVIVVKL